MRKLNAEVYVTVCCLSIIVTRTQSKASQDLKSIF